MALETVDAIAAALPNAQLLRAIKTSMTAKGAGLYQSLWAQGHTPPAGAVAGSVNGVIPTKATTGALVYVDPTAGLLSYIERTLATIQQKGTIVLFDRLWHNSGLDGNSVALQAIVQPALTRYTDAEGVHLWGEVHTPFGAGNATFTALYTNQSAASPKTGVYVYNHGAPVAGQMFPFSRAAGDRGVKSVQSVQLSAGTGVVGNFGLLLMKELCSIAMDEAGKPVVYDFLRTGRRKIADDACLCLMVIPSGAATGDLDLRIDANQG